MSIRSPARKLTSAKLFSTTAGGTGGAASSGPGSSLRWIRLRAGLYQTTVGSGVETPGDSAEGDSTPEGAAEESSTRARAINQRVSGWAYRIPQYKFDSMNKRLEDLLLAVKDTDE